MQTRRRKNGLRGTLIFVLPIAVIMGVVLYQTFIGTFYKDGTVSVLAQTTERFFPARALTAEVTVGGQTGTTPCNISVTQGTYTVTFGSLPWYTTPPAREVDVAAGSVAYAVGVYKPIQRVIKISSAGFNTTAVTALNQVTPVTWLNGMGTYAVLNGSPFGRIIIPPNQNYTYVFQSAGSYDFSLLASSEVGTVKVS